MHTEFELENLKGKDCLGYVSIDGKIILKWILERVWTEFGGLSIGSIARLL
jgi:hypothetical protein